MNGYIRVYVLLIEGKILKNKYIFLVILFLSISCGEKKSVIYEVPGRIGTEVLSIPKVYVRTYKGGVTGSLVVPYKDMPKVGQYFLPGNGSNKLDISPLMIDVNLYKERIRKSKIKFIKDVIKYEEIPSEFPNYKKYGPKNYDQLGNVNFFYVSKDMVINCAVNCRYGGVFNDNIVFKYGFPKSEIIYIEKIDTSVKTLIKQFIDDYKH